MKKSITIIIALAFAVCFCVGCNMEKSKTVEELASTTNIAASEIPPTFYTVQELVDAIKSGVYTDNTGTYAMESISKNLPELYAPSSNFDGFSLIKIELTEYRLIFYYAPEDAVDKLFDYSTSIVAAYCVEKLPYSDLTPMDVIAKQFELSKTADGFLYDASRNTIYFEVGESWMSISVPDSMNTYEVLKSMCSATKISIVDVAK